MQHRIEAVRVRRHPLTSLLLFHMSNAPAEESKFDIRTYSYGHQLRRCANVPHVESAGECPTRYSAGDGYLGHDAISTMTHLIYCPRS